MTGNERPTIRDSLARELPKRFYEKAEVAPADGGFAVLLDDMPVRTPRKAKLVLPVRAVAEAVAGEFEAQDKTIDPAAMPMTRLANSALDAVETAMDTVADDFAAYAGSDLLCYRAETPEELAARQAQHWDPLLDWVAGEVGSRFHVIAGIVHHAQPEEAVAAMREHARAFDCFGLCALQTITTITGSAVLALALSRGYVDVDTAWTAAHVDEDWQIEHWGEDMEAQQQRARRRRDFDAACRMLEMVQR